MKYVKKNLFGIGIACSILLGVGFSFVPKTARANAQVQGWFDGVKIEDHYDEVTEAQTEILGEIPIGVSITIKKKLKSTVRDCSGYGIYCDDSKNYTITY